MLDFLADHGAEGLDLGMGVGSEGAGPSDVAMTTPGSTRFAFAKGPALPLNIFFSAK